MSLLHLDQVSLAYGDKPLLDHAELRIEAGERVCLVGRNGEGKSTLLKLILGINHADAGHVRIDPGVVIGHLEQELPEQRSISVFDSVAEGLGKVGAVIRDYHHVIQQVTDDPSDANLKKLEHLQHELEAQDGWSLEQRVESTLSRLELDPDADFGSLSGGWRRRVLLARALVPQPNLLLLDEPTNHLDIEAIQWLEKTMLDWPGALLFITHDRALANHLATRIIELDRGHLTSWPGNFKQYQQRKAEALEVEARHNAEFDKKLAQEEVWIRQGIKARRTRNEGRVRALEAMRRERSDRRQRQGKAKLKLEAGERSGKLVIEAQDLSYGWDDKPIVSHLDTVIMRGDRVGLIGPNGSGKTTLLKLLLGDLKPDSGRVRTGTKLELAYFDQAREQLDQDATVRDTVGEGSDYIELGGKRQHVMGYLQDFLFSPQRARSPVKSLSGGERNRLLLARLFSRSNNLLVMDEPTNDLDVETLELLEERLVEYPGTLLLVSHDREFLDNVVTSTLVLEGNGQVGDYVGGYSDWLKHRQAKPAKPANKPAKASTTSPPGTAAKPTKPAKKRSFKVQRELDALPKRIEELEQQQQTLTEQTAQPDFYRQDQQQITATLQQIEQVEQELGEAYERWEQLEDEG